MSCCRSPSGDDSLVIVRPRASTSSTAGNSSSLAPESSSGGSAGELSGSPRTPAEPLSCRSITPEPHTHPASFPSPSFPAEENTPTDLPEEVRAAKESSACLIPLDLRRTFPHLQFFREGPEYDNLYMVLDLFVQLRPDVGYVQGMTYLAAILLLHMDCYTAFLCLANMLTKYHFLAFYQMRLRDMNVHLLTFDMLLQDQLPEVHGRFQAFGLRPEFFCIDWFVTLYSKSLPLDISSRIWDLFFMDSDYLYKAGLAIIKYYVQIFTTADFEDVFEFITHLPKKINEGTFFSILLGLDIPPKRLRAIKQTAQRTATDKIG